MVGPSAQKALGAVNKRVIAGVLESGQGADSEMSG